MTRLDERREGAGATEGMSRISAMQAIPLVLVELGFDPAEILAEVDVDSRLFASANNLIRDARVGPLLSHCVARTGCESFALRVGQHAGVASLGLLGALARSAPDVGTALRMLSRFLSLNDGAAIASVTTEGEFSSLRYAIYERGIPGTSNVYQMVAAAACNVLRDLCGPDWTPSDVLIPCRRPLEVRPFRDFFRAPIRFDADRLTLLFRRRWLDEPLRSSDAKLHETLSLRAASIEAHAPPGLPSQVRRVMRNLLLESKGSIEAVARSFSMHRRTLDRHLDANGASFRNLADEVRFEVACQLLRDTQMSVSEIAASLHYGDASAFAHAFRRWSGATATQWRESAGDSPRNAADAGAGTLFPHA